MLDVIVSEKMVARGLVGDSIAGGDNRLRARSEKGKEDRSVAVTHGLDEDIDCFLRRREGLLAIGLTIRVRQGESREAEQCTERHRFSGMTDIRGILHCDQPPEA